jgi:hypothetical protein
MRPPTWISVDGAGLTSPTLGHPVHEAEVADSRAMADCGLRYVQRTLARAKITNLSRGCARFAKELARG